ncbi:MAG TPA: nucleotide sugar dehydrogenase [Pyrinomonadaceae bacterium]
MTNNKSKYDVLIIGGLGHIGLPLGILLADTGLQVTLYDLDLKKRAIVEAGEMPFLEYDAEPILKRVIGKTLHIADSLEDVADSDTVIVTIGTPVDEYLNPKMLPILQLAEQLTRYLHDDHHIMLRSTVFPGTSQRLHDFFSSRGLKIDLSFCPERIIQGHAVRELGHLPQIISGFTEQAVSRAEALFEKLRVRMVKVSVREAELAKLFTNAWRYIQFAIANQFYVMATEHDADFGKIHHAMTYGYDRAKDFPTPGLAAGPCLLKDTLQLSAFHQNHFQLGHAAMLINEGLPNFIVENLRKSHGADLGKSRVGVLGMAFKADIDDIRDSLSYKLAKILKFYGASVVCSDEYVQDPTFISKEELIATCPIVIIGVPHTAYRQLEIPSGTTVVDLWNTVNHPSTY